MFVAKVSTRVAVQLVAVMLALVTTNYLCHFGSFLLEFIVGFLPCFLGADYLLCKAVGESYA